MSSERGRMAFALFLSVLLHAPLLSLTIGHGFGLPGFSFAWRDRRIEAPELRVVLAPRPVAPAAANAHAVPPADKPVPGRPAATPSTAAAPPPGEKALTILPATRNRVEAESTEVAVAGLASAKAPTPVAGLDHAAPAKVPKRRAVNVPPSKSPAPLVRAKPPVATPVVPVPPIDSTPDTVTSALGKAGEVPPDAERLGSAQEEAQRREAESREIDRLAEEQREAQGRELARQEEESARIEAARQEAERQQAARLAAEQLEAQRRELARQREEAARIDAARQAAERQEAAQLAAERQEAQRRQLALQQEEAALKEAARREAERQQAAQLAAEQQEAQRRELARQKDEAARIEAARREAERQQAAQLAAEQQEAQRRELARQQEEAARNEAARREAERQQAAQLAAERQEAQRRELARQQEEASRNEAARLEAERQQAARQAAEQLEAQRREFARQQEEAARNEAARREAERQQAARLAAEQQEAQRRELARQREEAARIEAARRAAERPLAARPAAEPDTQRQEAARLPAPAAALLPAEQEEAKRQERLRAIGRQLDEEAARRTQAAPDDRPPSTLPLTLSTARRVRLFGRTHPNAELVRYAEAWARKIELNTPTGTASDAATKLRIDPVVTVAVRSDGSVESVNFELSSGVPDVDEAIRRIVRSHEHYQAFPPALRRDYDVIEIRRTWHFDIAVRLY